MILESEVFGDVVVLHLPDEVNQDNAERAGAAFMEPLQQDRSKFVVDLEKTDFLDSAALELLLDMQDRVRSQGGDLRVGGSSESARKILEVTRLDGRIEVFDSVRDAVMSYQ